MTSAQNKVYHLLVATDFSEASWHALQYAILLFSGQPAVFYLLHVYQPPVPNTRLLGATVTDLSVSTLAHEAAHQGLIDCINRIDFAGKLPHHQFIPHASFDLLTEATRLMIDQHHIDFVFIGIKGQHPSSHLLWGSHTHKMVKAALKCPVIAVPEDSQLRLPKRVAMATDLKRPVHPWAVEPLLMMAERLDAQLDLVHVQSYDQSIDEEQSVHLLRWQKLLGDGEYHRVRPQLDGSVAHALTDFTQQAPLDLWAMQYFAHTWIEDLTKEAIIRKAIFTTQVPLMVLPADC